MTEKMEIAIISKAKQGYIYKYILDHCMSASGLAREIGIAPTQMGKIINFGWLPSLRGTGPKLVKKIEDYFHLPIEFLFPPELTREIAEKLSRHHVLIEEVDFVSLGCAKNVAYIGYDSEAEEKCSVLDEQLAALSEREQYIVRSRFGFDGEPKTLDILAKERGLSGNRIRQIEAKAIKKLQHRFYGIQKKSVQPIVVDESPVRKLRNPSRRRLLKAVAA